MDRREGGGRVCGQRARRCSYMNRSGFASVSSILFERKSEDSNPLSTDGVEERGDNLVDESVLLVVVDLYNLRPVFSHFWQAQGCSDVRQVENILLEARPSKAHRGLEELGSQARVHSDGAGYLVYVSTRGLQKVDTHTHTRVLHRSETRRPLSLVVLDRERGGNMKKKKLLAADRACVPRRLQRWC